MSARDKTNTLMLRAQNRGINLSFWDAERLRRAELTLQRWAEMECGDSNDHCSWSIERDEATGKPYRCVYPHSESKVHRSPTPDRQQGALKRIQAICKEYGLHYYHQTDPRGCALYIDREPLPENNYSRGLACSV